MFLPAQNPAEGEHNALSPEAMLNRPFVRSVIRFATRRTGSAIHDEDLEQEALLRILQAIHRRSRIEYPKALVVKIVRDTVADHWRQRRWLTTLIRFLTLCWPTVQVSRRASTIGEECASSTTLCSGCLPENERRSNCSISSNCRLRISRSDSAPRPRL